MPPRATQVEDSTVEQVVAFVREGIIAGDYRPGVKLLPKQIAESFGTSFIPVREALRVLESEGFVSFVHNRGAWVTPLSKADLHDIYMIRIELECEAVRQAAPLTKAEIAHLDGILATSRDRHKQRDNAALVALNREFHFAIYEKAGSPRRLKVIDQLWLHSARYQRLALNNRNDGAVAEHGRMLTKLRRGDHEGAAAALKSHLETTVRLMSQEIDHGEADGASSLLTEHSLV
jgi:DNA-binding GntR family transcriptional regulator